MKLILFSILLTSCLVPFSQYQELENKYKSIERVNFLIQDKFHKLKEGIAILINTASKSNNRLLVNKCLDLSLKIVNKYPKKVIKTEREFNKFKAYIVELSRDYNELKLEQETHIVQVNKSEKSYTSYYLLGSLGVILFIFLMNKSKSVGSFVSNFIANWFKGKK